MLHGFHRNLTHSIGTVRGVLACLVTWGIAPWAPRIMDAWAPWASIIDAWAPWACTDSGMMFLIENFPNSKFVKNFKLNMRALWFFFSTNKRYLKGCTRPLATDFTSGARAGPSLPSPRDHPTYPLLRPSSRGSSRWPE